jgi:Family of unknown function (DUF6131)
MTSVMTKPAIPTTMSTTPTVDRLIPLTDVVTANFKIAPIAINTKLEPIRISRPLSSGSWTPQGYRAPSHTRLSLPRPPEALRSAPISRSVNFAATVLPPAPAGPPTQGGKEPQMIILGIVLVVVGLLVKSLSVLFTIGIILLVVGAILWVLGSMGRAVGGRKHYY